MIEKTFRCDLCKEQCQPTSEDLHARRVKWSGTYRKGQISLVPLTDDSASEKLFCGNCLANLRAALEIKDLTWEKS